MILPRLIPLELLRACPVCFGDDGSGMADGLRWGIILLLGATALMVGGIFALAARVERARQD